MLTSLKYILVLLHFMFYNPFTSQGQTKGKIVVVISNLKVATGQMHVGLYNKADDFPDKAFDGKIVPVSAASVTVVFDAVSDGDYALSVFHDQNSNGELDTNFIGIPKEGFAFGNNAIGAFGPPSFHKAKITVAGTTVKQDIALRHF
jgi:uncharacterized protein (DUF2141 family)